MTTESQVKEAMWYAACEISHRPLHERDINAILERHLLPLLEQPPEPVSEAARRAANKYFGEIIGPYDSMSGSAVYPGRSRLTDIIQTAISAETSPLEARLTRAIDIANQNHAEIERLREALQVFADAADRWEWWRSKERGHDADEKFPDSYVLLSAGWPKNDSFVTVGDLRKARLALRRGE